MVMLGGAGTLRGPVAGAAVLSIVPEIFLNVVTGLPREDDGETRLDGRNLRGVPAYARARLGLAKTFQLTRAFRSFTVAEAVKGIRS